MALASCFLHETSFLGIAGVELAQILLWPEDRAGTPGKHRDTPDHRELAEPPPNPDLPPLARPPTATEALSLGHLYP